MQKSKYLKHNRSLLIVIVCIITLGIMSCFYIYNISQLLKSGTRELLKEVTVQGADSLENKIEAEFALLEILALESVSDSDHSLEHRLEKLQLAGELRNALHIGLATPDGQLMSYDTMPIDISDREYFKQSMKGKRAISEPLISNFNKQPAIAYSVPIIENGEVVEVLVATYDANYLIGKIMMEFFSGKGKGYLTNEEGRILFCSEVTKQEEKAHSILEHIQNTQRVEILGNGCTKLKDNNYYYYEEIASTKGWYFVCSIPVGIIIQDFGKIIQQMALVAVFIILIFSMSIIYVILMDKKAKKEIYNLAYIDPQTGLYNQNKFVREAKNQLKKNPDKEHAIIYFDVNNFELLNDIFGYKFGDQILQHIAREIEKLLDRQGILYAHLMNKHFVIMVPYIEKNKIISIIKIIEEKLEHTQIVDYPSIHIIISTGVYLIPKGDNDIYQSLNKARIARETLKGQNEERYKFFDEQGNEELKQQKIIENNILEALNNEEFRVYYQPKVSLSDKQIRGAEALIRWQHPTDGMISPGKFIPIAENNGSIIQITEYVILQVCKDLWKWQRQGKQIVPISINFSKIEMYNAHILEYLRQTIADYDINPKWIEIEITERIAIEDMQTAKRIITHFKGLGLQVSMDDFGSGYSAAKNLKNLPFDTIKIDKSLIDDIDVDDKSKQFLEGMVNIIKALGCQIVAEGVENLTQAGYIEEMGVDFAQGFVFAKPLEAQEFETHLVSNIKM